MGRRAAAFGWAVGALVFLALLGAPTASLAYTPTTSGSGLQVRWPDGFRYNLAGNSANSTGLAPEFLRASTVRGLQRWQRASQSAIHFDYWQGEEPTIYEPNSEYNGLSSIYFASNSQISPGSGASVVSPNVLGLTQVWYNTTNGQILEADIILNDRDYEFTGDPRDTSGPGTSGGLTGSPGPTGSFRRSRVYLDNVITHELGHAFGLSHSGAMQATMLYMESPEQARLGCDDIAGISSIYPSGQGRPAERSAINGFVRNQLGSPVLGAQVSAISATRGTLLASALTDRGGRYSIQGLEPGSYYVVVEPFYAGSSALPAYYESLEQSCPDNEIFSRVFLTRPASSALLEISVPPGATAAVPEAVVTCTSGRAGAVINENARSASVSTAPVAFDSAASPNANFGFVERVDNGGLRYYELRNLSGKIEIKGLSFSLYSPVRANLALVNERGGTVPTRSIERAYVGDSGFTDFDTLLVAENLPPGNYLLEVSGSRLSPASYPGGQLPIDSVPFVMVTGVRGGSQPSMPEIFPLNSRCASPEVFAAYTSPLGIPPRTSLLEEEKVGFCGSLKNRSSGNQGGSSGDSGAPLGQVIGWFLPYVLALALRLGSRGLRSPARPVILSMR